MSKGIQTVNKTDIYVKLKKQDGLTKEQKDELYVLCINRINHSQVDILDALKTVFDQGLYIHRNFTNFKDWAIKECPIRPELAMLYVSCITKFNNIDVVARLTANQSILKNVLSDKNIKSARIENGQLFLITNDNEAFSDTDYLDAIRQNESIKKAGAKSGSEVRTKENLLPKTVSDSIQKLLEIRELVRSASMVAKEAMEPMVIKNNLTNLLDNWDEIKKLLVSELSEFLFERTVSSNIVDGEYTDASAEPKQLETDSVHTEETNKKADILSPEKEVFHFGVEDIVEVELPNLNKKSKMKLLTEFWKEVHALQDAIAGENIDAAFNHALWIFRNMSVLRAWNLDNSIVNKLSVILKNEQDIGYVDLERQVDAWRNEVIEIL